MSLKALNPLKDSSNSSHKMPVLFLGHGSPMNAIEENEFVKGFRYIGQEVPKPKAILCISAHWETKGSFVTAMEKPKTIHDFGGFPPALYQVQYPAPGSPELAKEVKDMIQNTEIGLDQSWGVDHGAWSVIKHLYPEANIPVLQMSIDYTKGAQYHFELAKELSILRTKGVLIIGSGNIVHNLVMIAWDKMNAGPYAFDWATEVNEKIKDFSLNGDYQSLIDYKKQGKEFQLAIPTPEHYLPLLYSLALRSKDESLKFFNDKPVGGSISMTSMKIG